MPTWVAPWGDWQAGGWAESWTSFLRSALPPFTSGLLFMLLTAFVPSLLCFPLKSSPKCVRSEGLLVLSVLAEGICKANILCKGLPFGLHCLFFLLGGVFRVRLV